MPTPGHPLPRDLGDGLAMRRATPADTDALAAFNADIHRVPWHDGPNEEMGIWTRDLMRGDHPTFSPDGFLIVEDTRTGAIVSSLNLIPQTWSYAGVEVGVGRPEIVGTHPDYRGRGLVRAQFEVIHAWSVRQGHLMQAITGIPWFYRQFGYEMALALDGARFGPLAAVPPLKEGEAEAYRVRPAARGDLPFLIAVARHAAERHVVACVRDEALWAYELDGRSEKSAARREIRIVETMSGEPVGFLVHPGWLWGSSVTTNAHELKPGVSWLAATPAVLRYLKATGEAYAARDGKTPDSLAFHLGAEHPLYQVLGDRLPAVREPYAWYIRVPDVPAFVRHVAPALERRLAQSLAVGHTGELKLSFFRSGLRLAFEEGRLAAAEAWEPPQEEGDAAFPDLTFLQLLFGYRSLAELEHAFADCRASNEARLLVEALFPKQNSEVWGVQ